MANEVHLLGIRHHGPGSARALLRALDSIRPGCVLLEGPPDADDIVSWVTHEEMKPPVSILVYQADDAKNAVFYPFAEFSPEWNALRWALKNEVPIRFMDLPQSHRMALDSSTGPSDESRDDASEKPEVSPSSDEISLEDLESRILRRDPLRWLAQAAGFEDGERWWEHMFEHRRVEDVEVFAAVREAMGALRESAGNDASAVHAFGRDEPFREAWMRRSIRQAQKEYEHVAVVCGAWHVPALTAEVLKSSKKEDDVLLKGLSKVKTAATWIPWTYDRMASASGYAAGVQSPGWYEHIWKNETDILERWLTRVGRLLRDEEIDCSSAHIIEAIRLANSLAALRGRPLADLSDIMDACRAVFCFDGDLALQLIGRRLFVGDRLGEVPAETPLVPLQQDLQRQQKSLRLKPESLEKTLDLDLRNENDLKRSELLHRLRLLGIDWGTPQEARGGKGTFHELWKLRWAPEFLVRLIELGVWGSTIESASSGFCCDTAEKATDLEPLAKLLGDVMLANLPQAVEVLMKQILSTAAIASDVTKLMDALPPLANVHRYGNVRQTDKGLVRRAIDGIFPRIIVGLGGATASLSDDAAAQMIIRIVRVYESVQLLESPAEVDEYMTCLTRISEQPSVHGLVSGRVTRLLFDQRTLSSSDVATRLSLTLSRGEDPAQAAQWIEGFLSSSGLVLVHHADLLALIDDWVGSISTESFDAQIPILRRTFSSFAAAERRQIGERIRLGSGSNSTEVKDAGGLDTHRAARVLPLLRTIFGTSQIGKES